MKILLLYTARTGSTSILNYFSKMKPEYKCYRDPWFDWLVSEYYNNNTIEYTDIIKNQNLFVKSTYKNLPVPIEHIVDDFDKIIILLRRNIEEQIESSILANRDRSYFDRTKRKYKTYTITDDEREHYLESYKQLNTEFLSISDKYSLPLFYYEDLYYGHFDKLFSELQIDYNFEYFTEFLDNKNRYRIGVEEIKKINTLI